MNIIKKISKYNHTKYKNRRIKYIVIHWVGAVSTAKNNATYFANGNRMASAHYFVDDNSIYQLVLDKNAAWHCGGGRQGSGGGSLLGECLNANSIGIEMCCKKGMIIGDKTLKNTGELVHYLCDKYNVPESRVVRHYDVTGKDCPHPFINSSKWSDLKASWFSKKKVKPTTLKAPAKTVKKGSTGTNVKRLQQFLNWYLGISLAVDGSFGNATLRAFKTFQAKVGLTVDGSCGPKSIAKIKSIIKTKKRG